MAESTLAIAYKELQANVANFLGWSMGVAYGEAAWDTRQQFKLDRILASGIRQVIHPPPEREGASPYGWSWLHPTSTLTLAQGASTTPLPDDFGGFEGEITVSSLTNGLLCVPLKFMNVGQLLAKYAQLPTTTARPQMASVQWLKGTTGSSGQRAQLMIWPLPDQDYTLQFQYYLLPDVVNAAQPYPLGGTQMAELYLESCLAVAEGDPDDVGPRGGNHQDRFRERLAAAIGIDRRSKPRNLGYNGDDSDIQSIRGRWVWHGSITYNGMSL